MGVLSLKRNDTYRFLQINNQYDDGLNSYNKYRTEYSRDYARVLHSPSFRRLQNKTQLFPGQESDFFRNRLTHSLEVSQIAKDIAYKFNKEDKNKTFIIPEVCEIAGLLHDIGHPPFGHNGERALDDCMRGCGGFEGNAQTMHIILRTEKKELLNGMPFDENGNDCRVGLNLTMRSIASTLKYDHIIPAIRNQFNEFQKGYYECDKALICKVKEKLIGNPNFQGFKTIECSIMDIADDIAYSTYDMEDAFKAGFLTPLKIISESDEIYEQISKKLKENNINIGSDECRNMLIDLFLDILTEQNKSETDFENPSVSSGIIAKAMNIYTLSENLASDGYYRTGFSSYLVSRFIGGLSLDYNEKTPILSKVCVDRDTFILINILKHFAYICLINSSMLKVVENRGYDIIRKMFERLSEKEGYKLLPEDFQYLYFKANNDAARSRIICDFISGMTDRYALEFYGRLFSDNPQTIFKPL